MRFSDQSYSGRVLEELKVRRSDIILTSKVFFGTRKGPNDTGLSRKQYVFSCLE